MNIFLIETGIEIVMITTRNKISTSGETVTLEDIKRTNSFYPSPDHLYLAKVVTKKKKKKKLQIFLHEIRNLWNIKKQRNVFKYFSIY